MAATRGTKVRPTTVRHEPFGGVDVRIEGRAVRSVPVVSYREDPSPLLGLIYIVVYLAILVALCVAVVKGVNATRRWWRRRQGLPEDPEAGD
jgi:hypothetical protein